MSFVPFEKSDKFNGLANKLKGGDKKAGEEIFAYFSPKFYRYFMARTLQKESAEDLTQDVFLKIIDNIKTYKEEKGDFTFWAWQIAKNSVKDYYRKNSKKEISVAEFIGKYNIVKDEKADFDEKIKVEEIMKMVKGFSEEEQELFSLYYVSDLPYKEISKLLGKPEGSLRVSTHRIAKKIRSLSEKQDVYGA